MANESTQFSAQNSPDKKNKQAPQHNQKTGQGGGFAKMDELASKTEHGK